MKPRHQKLAASFVGTLCVVGMALAAGPAKTSKPQPAADQRAPLVLLDAERHLVLEEMRNFLAVLQTITDALPREDMKEVARAARSMGSGAANEIPPVTVAKLPEEFKVLAGGVHTSFDLIALDAESLGDPKHTVSQVAEMLQKCNACHGIYQIKVGKDVRAKSKAN
ncbi:hypothetical protein [Sulfuritalea hydrogenivorans]|jgi:hypothetical protein|uniref:Cytochrome C n=1 Tax=Sulfuritalea hydrogenivorans sk43H TaxID=1223802 RepID=W0SJC8_9PROT|nr:hypothetical protein [Sulfuritalea hydrogenivorans]MDK9713714.1 hypothetical protein [Sulfuritalea sp.]BAO31212.1 hypothetical protein SUTH_03442 [Sulfuritalea hydrogenivorans sk43H]